MLDFAGKLCDVTGCHQHLVKPRFIASAAALLVAVGLDTVFYFFPLVFYSHACLRLLLFAGVFFLLPQTHT